MPRAFKISDAHMQAFSTQQRVRFEDEMAVYLRKEYPAEAKKYTEKGLRDMIRDGIEIAKGYNITLECDVARYIELMLALAPDFDDSPKTPWAKEILTQRRATAPQKLDRIYEHLAFAPPAETGAKTGARKNP